MWRSRFILLIFSSFERIQSHSRRLSLWSPVSMSGERMCYIHDQSRARSGQVLCKHHHCGDQPGSLLWKMENQGIQPSVTELGMFIEDQIALFLPFPEHLPSGCWGLKGFHTSVGLSLAPISLSLLFTHDFKIKSTLLTNMKGIASVFNSGCYFQCCPWPVSSPAIAHADGLALDFCQRWKKST